jgi:hypothetical protein
MKANFSFALLVVLVTALVLSACGGQPVSAQGFGTEEFIEALQAKGVDAERGDSVEQAFFSVVGDYVNFNDESVQVFEYETSATMESDAQLVDASGSPIGNSMVSWIATPHFYKKGRILVLYIGDNAQALDTLESVLGPQFAGG